MTTILMMMRMSCLISHAPVTEFWKYFPCRIDSMTLWCSLWKYLPPSVCFQSLEFSFLCDESILSQLWEMYQHRPWSCHEWKNQWIWRGKGLIWITALISRTTLTKYIGTIYRGLPPRSPPPGALLCFFNLFNQLEKSYISLTFMEGSFPLQELIQSSLTFPHIHYLSVPCSFSSSPLLYPWSSDLTSRLFPSLSRRFPT